MTSLIIIFCYGCSKGIVLNNMGQDSKTQVDTTQPLCNINYSTDARLSSYGSNVVAASQGIDRTYSLNLKDNNLEDLTVLTHPKAINNTNTNIVAIEYVFEQIATANIETVYTFMASSSDLTKHMAFNIIDNQDGTFDISYYTDTTGVTSIQTNIIGQLLDHNVLFYHDEFKQRIGIIYNDKEWIIPVKEEIGEEYFLSLLSTNSAGNFLEENTKISIKTDISLWTTQKFNASDLCTKNINSLISFSNETLEEPLLNTKAAFNGIDGLQISIISENEFKVKDDAGLFSGFVASQKGFKFDGTADQAIQFELEITEGLADSKQMGISLYGAGYISIIAESDGTYSITDLDSNVINSGATDFFLPNTRMGIIIESDYDLTLYKNQNGIITSIATIAIPLANPVITGIAPLSLAYVLGPEINKTSVMKIHNQLNTLGDISGLTALTPTNFMESTYTENIQIGTSIFHSSTMNGSAPLSNFMNEKVIFENSSNDYGTWFLLWNIWFGAGSTPNHLKPLLLSHSPDAYDFYATFSFTGAADQDHVGGVIFDAIDESNYKIFRYNLDAPLINWVWKVEQITAGAVSNTIQSGSLVKAHDMNLIRVEKLESVTNVNIYFNGNLLTNIIGITAQGSTRKTGIYLEGDMLCPEFVIY